MGKGSGYGKTIFFGEHFTVYGAYVSPDTRKSAARKSSPSHRKERIPSHQDKGWSKLRKGVTHEVFSEKR